MKNRDAIDKKVTEFTANLFDSDNNAKKQAGLVYYKLCKQANDLKNDKQEDVKQRLWEISGIDTKIRKIVGPEKSCPGMVLVYGTKNYVEFVVAGNQQEYVLSSEGTLIPKIEKMTKESVFDLASITKLFTCLSLFKLYENGLIDLCEPISRYDKRFKNIGHLTIENLMGYQRKIVTPERIDCFQTLEDAEKTLFEIQEYPIDLRPYSDMNSIVLKYIIEKAVRKSFFDVIQEYLLMPSHMWDTKIAYSEKELDHLVNNNFELRLNQDKFVLDTQTKKGVVHDRKARLLSRGGMDLSGHAGLFSNGADMSALLQSMLEEKVICKKNLLQISKKRIGFQNEDGEYSQYLGMLCHTKHPRERQSEVYKILSDASFGQGGYTGTYYSVDPLNGVFVFLGTNRCHHRITSVTNCSDTFIKQQKLVFPISKDFAWERDEICYCALNLALQYRYLEGLELNKPDVSISSKTYYLE